MLTFNCFDFPLYNFVVFIDLFFFLTMFYFLLLDLYLFLLCSDNALAYTEGLVRFRFEMMFW